MPTYRYSFQNYNPIVHVRASAREINVSPKAAREVCKSIHGRKLTDALTFLEDVINLKRPVHFRRHKKEVAHRTSTEKFHAGKFPVKTAQRISNLINEVESNADFKGLDTKNIRIIHAAAHRARKIPGFKPRAQGRSTPFIHELVHVEIVAG